MSTRSLIVLAIIVLMVAAAIAHLVNNRRKGKNDCGCGCTKCNRCSGPNVDIEDCCRKDDRSGPA